MHLVVIQDTLSGAGHGAPGAVVLVPDKETADRLLAAFRDRYRRPDDPTSLDEAALARDGLGITPGYATRAYVRIPEAMADYLTLERGCALMPFMTVYVDHVMEGVDP